MLETLRFRESTLVLDTIPAPIGRAARKPSTCRIRSTALLRELDPATLRRTATAPSFRPPAKEACTYRRYTTSICIQERPPVDIKVSQLSASTE
jgi:hypothetical protein